MVRKRICLKLCSALTVIFFTLSTLAAVRPADAQILAAPNAPLVVLIQEAHANYESQENIARALNRIYAEHNRPDALIALEGTPFGTDVDPIVFRAFPIEKIRQNVSESFLKTGKIDGAEFFAANDAPNSRLTGIEDAALYQKNLAAFRNFYPHQHESLSELRKMRSGIEKKKKRVYGKPMLDLETSQTRFAKDSSTLFLHLSVLKQLAKLKSIDMSKYPAIGQTKPPLEMSLFRQISELELVLRRTLPRSIEEKKLARADRKLELLEKLASISLTREEYDELKKVADTLREEGIGHLSPALEFYALAEKRDHALAANVLELIKKQNHKIVFVITGGFHTSGIQETLEKNNIACAILAPRAGMQSDRSDYFARLEGKSTLRPERVDYSLGALLTLTGELVKSGTPNTPQVMRQYEHNLAAKLSRKSETLSVAREIAGTLTQTGFRFTLRGKKIRVRIPPQQASAASLGETPKRFPEHIKLKMLELYSQGLAKISGPTAQLLDRIRHAIADKKPPTTGYFIRFERLIVEQDGKYRKFVEWWPNEPVKTAKLTSVPLTGMQQGVTAANGETYRIQLFFRQNPSSGRLPILPAAPPIPAKPEERTGVMMPGTPIVPPPIPAPAVQPKAPDVFEIDLDDLNKPEPPPPAKITVTDYIDLFEKKLAETGNFRDISFIAKGAMGLVFKATQITPEGERVVAVKTVHPDWLADENTLKRFTIEGKAMAKVQARSSIAKIHVVRFYELAEIDIPGSGKVPYLVMEYLDEAKSLEDLIRQSPEVEIEKEFGQKGKVRRVPVAIAAKLIQRIAAAIHAFHEEKMVHRDIKPANIGLKLVRAKDRERLRPARIDLGNIHGDFIPILLDLGLVKRVRGSTEGTDSLQSVTKSGEVMGTPMFMAPEQAIDSKKVDGRSDVYALAATLLFMITGRHAMPFKPGEKFFPGYALRLVDDEEREKALTESLRPLDQLGLPEKRTGELKAIFMHAIAAPLEERYPNAKKFADDLAAFRHNLEKKSRGRSLGKAAIIKNQEPVKGNRPEKIKSFSPMVMEFDRNVLNQLLDPQKDPRAGNKSLAVVFLVHDTKLKKQLEREYGKLLRDHHIYLITSKPLLADTNRTDLENLTGRLMVLIGPRLFPEGKVQKLRADQMVFVNGAFNKDWGKDILRVKYNGKRFRNERYRSAVLATSFYGLNHRDEWNDLFRLDTADTSYSILAKIINKFVFESQSERLTAQAA